MPRLFSLAAATGLLSAPPRVPTDVTRAEAQPAPALAPAPGPESAAKIEVRKVRKSYSLRTGGDAGVDALKDVDLDVRAGEFLSLLGPSGCGKSTLLDIVAGLATASSGGVFINGRRVDGPGLDRGVVFQGYALFPWRTVLENVAFGLETLGVPSKKRREIARHHLDLVGLGSFGERYPHELSGGMRQRVAIARALAFDPEILLMDEPFGALDTQTRERLQWELLRIQQETRKTVLFVTHSIDEAILLSDRVAVMTYRPGTIKTIVPVRLSGGNKDDDVRASPEFEGLHRRLWESLRDEVDKAAKQEYSR